MDKQCDEDHDSAEVLRHCAAFLGRRPVVVPPRILCGDVCVWVGEWWWGGKCERTLESRHLSRDTALLRHPQCLFITLCGLRGKKESKAQVSTRKQGNVVLRETVVSPAFTKRVA